MKIAYNPKDVTPLTGVSSDSQDIIFDLSGMAIYARGVKFLGTDTTYEVFTSTTTGLVPVPGNDNSNRFLRGDGTWAIPAGSSYNVMTLEEAIAGTSTDSRVITAKVLHDKISSTTHTSDHITALTGYSKPESTSDISSEDSLNTALGKLEVKADTAYKLITAANDEDGTIENLVEILEVLNGIKDTDTILAIVGKYLPLTGGTISGALAIKNSTASIELRNADASNRGFLAYGGSSTWKVSDNGWAHEYTLYHTGNLTSLKNPYALSWSGYSSGSYDGSSTQSITIPTNTNQLTNGAGFITSSALDWSNIANKPSLLTISNSNLVPDSVQTITDLIAKTGGWTLVRGSWSYANNGHIWVDDFGGNISLAGATILTAGTNNWSGYTHLFITSPTSDLSNALANEMLFYVNNGSDYSPSWTRVLTNRNYSSYALPLTGGTLTSEGAALKIKRTGTYANEPCITYYNDSTALGSIGVTDYNTPFFYNYSTRVITTIWHSGNDGRDSGLDADLLDGYHIAVQASAGTDASTIYFVT